MAKWQSTLGPRHRKLKELSDLIGKVNREARTCWSLYGDIGGKESKDETWTPFSTPREDVVARAAEIGATVGHVITEGNADSVIEAMRALLFDAIEKRPVVDHRLTEEDRRKFAEAAAAREKAEEERHAAFLNYYGKGPGSLVEAPADGMGVYLAVVFDNSEIQSDYHDRHANLGPRLILAFLPKGAEREATARAVLVRYPDLQAHKYTWHTEKYSMGHGNYLRSEAIDVPENFDRTAYSGRKVEKVFFEIVFDSYTKKVFPYKDYPGSDYDAPQEHSTGEITVRENEVKDGVEIKFSSKPNDATISALKSFGFRWSFKQRIWWARRNEQRMSFAYRLASPVHTPEVVEAQATA